MKKPLQIGFCILGTLCLLGGGVVWWAHQQRNRILQWILQEVNQNLNGQLSAKGLEFTPFANGSGMIFTLQAVAICDSACAYHHTNLLSVQYLSVGIGVENLLKGAFSLQSVGLENGSVRLFTQKNGYSNVAFFRSKNTRGNHLSSPNRFADQFFGGLKNVNFKNIAFQLDDSTTHKRFAFRLQNITNDLSRTPTHWHTRWQGGVYFEGLTFNAERGTFLQQKMTQTDFNLRFDPLQKYLYVDSSRLQIENDWFGLRGVFGFLEKGVFKLAIQTDTIATARALRIVPKLLAKTIADFGILPVVKANIKLNGLLNEGGTPCIDIAFQTDTFSYQTPLGPLTSIKATANYTNHLDTTRSTSDQNSRISVTRLNGLFYGVIPYRAVFTVSDLNAPQLAMNAILQADLARCNEFLDERYRFGEGKAVVTYRYRGKLFPLFDQKRNALNGQLTGKITLQKGNFRYNPQDVQISHVTGEIRFDQNTVRVLFLHLMHQRNLVKMSGLITGLLPFLFDSRGKVAADWAISTPDLGLDWIQNTKNTAPEQYKKRSLSTLIDNLLARLNCKLTVVANGVRFRQFRATQVRGKVYLNSKSAQLENIKMNAFGGSFSLSGGVKNLAAPIRQLYANGTISKADVKKVFQGFENFSQKTITDQHLSGTLSTQFSFNANVKKDFSILPNSMSAKVNIALEKGELTHFEPLKRVQRFIFKRRNFDQIRFATIQNEFNLAGKEVAINKMAIESSVLTMFVEGIYSFDNKTDLLLQIPLRNFKRRSADYELEKYDLQNLKGPNVFLRAVEIDGDIKIKYNLFKRGRQ